MKKITLKNRLALVAGGWALLMVGQVILNAIVEEEMAKVRNESIAKLVVYNAAHLIKR